LLGSQRLAIWFGNGKSFGKKILRNQTCSKMYEVFDLNEAYLNDVDEK
jgi:hypothetical protein